MPWPHSLVTGARDHRVRGVCRRARVGLTRLYSTLLRDRQRPWAKPALPRRPSCLDPTSLFGARRLLGVPPPVGPPGEPQQPRRQDAVRHDVENDQQEPPVPGWTWHDFVAAEDPRHVVPIRQRVGLEYRPENRNDRLPRASFQFPKVWASGAGNDYHLRSLGLRSPCEPLVRRIEPTPSDSIPITGSSRGTGVELGAGGLRSRCGGSQPPPEPVTSRLRRVSIMAISSSRRSGSIQTWEFELQGGQPSPEVALHLWNPSTRHIVRTYAVNPEWIDGLKSQYFVAQTKSQMGTPRVEITDLASGVTRELSLPLSPGDALVNLPVLAPHGAYLAWDVGAFGSVAENPIGRLDFPRLRLCSHSFGAFDWAPSSLSVHDVRMLDRVRGSDVVWPGTPAAVVVQ